MADAGKTAAQLPADDLVLPFRTVKSDVIGRVVRLGSAIDTVLSGHDYPEPVSYALGEALVLTAMLGSALKTQGKFILQTKTDGALDFLVADYVSPGNVDGVLPSSGINRPQGTRPGSPSARAGGSRPLPTPPTARRRSR